MTRQVKQYSFNGLAGCVTIRRSRETGTLVGVYHGLQSGYDADPDTPWTTVCEEHGCLIGNATLKLALASTADPTLFCDDCRSAEGK